MNHCKKTLAFFLTMAMLVGILLSGMPASAAGTQAVSVVEWNHTSAPASQTVPATSGVNMGGAVLTNFKSATPTYSTGSLCIAGGWQSGSGYWQISFSSQGYENMTIAANTRSSGTGPRDFKLVYSIDGGTSWKDISGSSYLITGTSLSSYMPTVILPADLSNKENVLIRFTMTSNTSESGSTVGSQGTSNINNIIVKGTVGEDPSTVGDVTAQPAGGAVALGSKIALSCETDVATIVYSVNNGPFVQYDPATQVTLDTLPANLKAYAIKSGMTDGRTSSWDFSQAKVVAVTADADSGTVDIGTRITLSCTTLGAGIKYSTDNGQSWNDYTAAITIESLPLTIQAKAVKTGMLDSDVSSFDYVQGPVQPEYNLYFGQLHSHTSLSDGSGSPSEAYAWARDQGKADFFAVTDHSNSFDNEFASENLTDWQNSTSSEWKLLNSTANTFNENGKFVAIAGYEMTWSNSNVGHINTFNTPWFMSRDNGISLSGYYDKLKQYPQSISQFNHPGTTFGYFEQFGNYSQAIDDVINLIEVGNGDGPVHQSGYWPSYEYYTMALDKGWHLAPSNNQDNHQKKWITANDARTVVLAPELTRDAIFDAIHNYRVYSTEDKNLRISYNVNGKVMGSSIGNAETLHFDIDVTDPDSTERISTISIISDGGTVAASKNFTGSTADWSFELPNNYSYYYVKVIENDQDIAVTAPVWSGALLPVGFSSLTPSQDPTTPGTEIDLTAVVYNNSTSALGSTSVEFYNGDSKIGESVITSIQPGKTGNAVLKWTPASIGDYTITAKASITVGSDVKQTQTSTTVKVLENNSIKHVVIDGGHYNSYVTGNYSGSYTELKELLDNNSYIADVNMDSLTAADLAGADVLILSDPGSTNDSYTQKSVYTAGELAVVNDFVQSGGSVIVASVSDYGEDTNGVTGEYQSAVQNNKVLEAIGSNMRFNDDELYDTVEYVGTYPFKLDFDEYINPDKYGIIDSAFTSQKFRFYSASSVITKAGGSDEAIDWLVNLHSTTTSYDSDRSGDSSNPAAGSFHAIGAELLAGGGKVVAAGAPFFSNYEFDDTLESTLSNKEMMLSLLEWMTTAGKISVSEARADADDNGIPDLMGQEVTVEGVVTAESTAYSEKYGRNNAFFDCIYIQDETGGITVFRVSQTELPIGAKVRITGTIDQYQGDTELEVANEASDITILDTGPINCAPEAMSTGDSMKEANEGWLVTVSGPVTKIESSNLYINDGTGEARVFVDGYIGDGTDNTDMLGKFNAAIKVGDSISAIGLASEDSSGHRLRVRNTAEVGGTIIKVAPELTADSTNNIAGVAVEITFTDNTEWRASITDVTVDSISLGSDKYIITAGKIKLDGSIFTQAKDYLVIIKAQNYNDASVAQTITAGELAAAPVLSADTDNNATGKNIEITYTDDPAWRDAINGITADGASIAASNYTVTAGKITIKGSVFTTAKAYTIIVKADGYADATVTQTVTGRPKAVIDGGHSNIYVSGDYPTKGTGMKAVLEEKGFDYVVNSGVLTDSVLAGVKVLILTDPGPSSTLSAAELTAVNNFVKAGGTLILTSRADYGDGSGNYQNSVQGNRVLEAIGSNIRFNDDEVVEGSSYTLYFNNYEIPSGETTSKHGIVDSSAASGQFRIYSASTVYLKANGDETAIDWLVKPNSSTTGTDADNRGDRITPPDGKIHMLGAELLSDGGKVVAAGCTFFSDYEINGTSYSNRAILGNMINWALTDGNEEKAAPVLNANAEGYALGNDVAISFIDNLEWHSAIVEIEAGDTVLQSGQYTFGTGSLTIDKSVFTAAGEYTVTMMANGYANATVNIKINETGVKVTGIEIQGGSSIDVKAGTLQLTAAVTPENAADKSVTWSVANTDGLATDIATISETGLLTAVKEGTVKVTAMANDGSGVKGELKVAITGQTVIPTITTTLTGPDRVKVGDTLTLSLKLYGAAGISAQDIIMSYDPAIFEFKGVTPAEGLTVWGTKADQGRVEVVAASNGADNAVTGNIKVLDFTFEVKASKASSVFTLTKAELSNLSGELTNAGLSSKTVIMLDKSILINNITEAESVLNNAVEGTEIGQYPEGAKARLAAAIEAAKAVRDNVNVSQDQIDAAVAALTQAVNKFESLVITSNTGNFNGNNRIDTGDLGLVAGYYGIREGDSGWAEASRYDIDGDSAIGIYDMAFIVLKILGT